MSYSENENTNEKDSNGCLTIVGIIIAIIAIIYVLKLMLPLLYRLVYAIEALFPFVFVIAVLWFLFKKK